MANNIENHLGLVRSIVAKFKHSYVELDDLYGIGCVALLEANSTYDSNKGSFSTWATKIIRQSIFDYFRKNKKESTVTYLENKEIECKKKIFPPDFLPILLKEEKDETDIEKQNKKILIDHFINDQSWAEIGRSLNLSRERVRQKGFDAILKIREKYRLILDEYESIYL